MRALTLAATAPSQGASAALSHGFLEGWFQSRKSVREAHRVEIVGSFVPTNLRTPPLWPDALVQRPIRKLSALPVKKEHTIGQFFDRFNFH